MFLTILFILIIFIVTQEAGIWVNHWNRKQETLPLDKCLPVCYTI